MISKIYIPFCLWICLSFFTNSLSAQKGRFTPNCPMNIIIAVDFSGSEMEYLDEIRTVLLALTDPFELDQAKLKVGIITFNRGAQMVLPLTGETQKMLDAIEGMDIVRMVYATDIHSAISLADQEFAKKTEGQVSNFFILISDGDPHAHARGYGWQSDIYNIERMKEGDIENQDFPIHVFTLYTGNMSSQWGRFSEEIRMASINHMKKMATDEHSFFYFHEHQSLVDFLLLISNCL